MSTNLFGENSSEEEKNELKTNKDYAKLYNKTRQKELLKKFKDREDDFSDSSSETSSDEEEVDPLFDKEFFKTLACLKSKNPEIYKKETKFFDKIQKSNEIGKVEKIKKQPFTLKEYERKIILENDGKFESDSDEDNMKLRHSPTLIDEEKAIKEEFKKILETDDNIEDEEFGGVFRKREKPSAQKIKEDANYKEWLAGNRDMIDSNEIKSLNPLKEYWNNPKLPKQEQFLRDYILNDGYINKYGDEIPTYDEIVGSEHFSEDEEELEKQDDFEHKFNFRFEEPDQEFIKRYPRTIEASVRKKDEKRKMKRQELKERKLKEKEQKFQEIKLLKELKRKEIEEKIEKLKLVTGNNELPFQENDLEEDFDPDLYDKKMQEVFNEEYYNVDEDVEKPECPDIEDLKVEDWDNFDPKNDNEINYDYEPHCEDDDFNMDCDYDPNSKTLEEELMNNIKGKRKRRNRRNRFMEMIKKEKPPFNPEDEKTYAEYIDEYYKMDCEDIINDIPCRFKYVETVPNDFGLTIEEILLAKNKELNQWASLKKVVQIRPEHVERNEAKMYRFKAKNEELKRKIFLSLYGEPEETEDNMNESLKINKQNLPEMKSLNDNQKDSKKEEGINTNDKSKAKDKKKLKLDKTTKGVTAELNVKPFKNQKINLKRLKSKKTNPISEKKSTMLSDERLKAYGINPTKFKKKNKYLNKNEICKNIKKKCETTTK